MNQIFPQEIIRYIGSYLSLDNILSMRLVNKKFHRSLVQLIEERIDRIPWRITLHTSINWNTKEYRVHHTWVSLGKFKDNTYPHEECISCYREVNSGNYNNNNDNNNNNNHTPDWHPGTTQLYTHILVGTGGPRVRKIISRIQRLRHDRYIGIIPNQINSNNYWIVSNDDFIVSPNNLNKQDQIIITKVYMGNIDIPSNGVTHDRKVRYGPFYDQARYMEWYVRNQPTKKRKPDHDLGDYDLSRYHNGRYIESDDSDSDMAEWYNPYD